MKVKKILCSVMAIAMLISGGAISVHAVSYTANFSHYYLGSDYNSNNGAYDKIYVNGAGYKINVTSFGGGASDSGIKFYSTGKSTPNTFTNTGTQYVGYVYLGQYATYTTFTRYAWANGIMTASGTVGIR